MATRLLVIIIAVLWLSSCGETCFDVRRVGLSFDGGVGLFLSIEPNDTVLLGDTVWLTSTIIKGSYFPVYNYCNLPDIEEGKLKNWLRFSIFRGNEIDYHEFTQNFPYCEKIVKVGEKVLWDPCYKFDTVVCSEYYQYFFNKFTNSYNLEIACVFVETGNFNFGSEIQLDIDGNINETAYPLVMISTSDFPLSKSSGYVKAPYVQTNSNRFPLTVVERK